MTNVSKYQMGLKLISISMLHLTSNIESSRQLLKETMTILVLTDSIESSSICRKFSGHYITIYINLPFTRTRYLDKKELVNLE